MECARNILKEFFRLVNCSLIAGPLSHIHPPPPCSPCQQWNDGHSQDNFHFSKVISWSTIAISRCLSRALSARSEKLRLVILINLKRTKGRLLLCKCTLKIMPAADIFFVQELICICLFFFLIVFSHGYIGAGRGGIHALVISVTSNMKNHEISLLFQTFL